MTGEDVPDEEARVPLLRYLNPRKAVWPEADYVVGNPPFIGARRIRSALGDEYVEMLRRTYKDVPDTCDYVMYWWHKAAQKVEEGRARRFGLITTNSIVQSYSRGLIERHLRKETGVRIIFAIPDHPWVESSDGAAVRVAMTAVISRREYLGKAILARVTNEEGEVVTLEQESVAFINESLKSAPESQNIGPLRANSNMCFQGVVPSGGGFKLEPHELSQAGYSEDTLPPVIRKYIIGRDLVRKHQPKFIIDFSGLSEEEARAQWPELYQWILDRVKQERKAKTGAGRTKDADEYARNWWLFAKTRPIMRRALKGLKRFIVTPYTAKHRPFIFVDGDTLPDAMAYAVASDDAFLLGVLSSRTHLVWALAAGGTLEDRPRYNSKTTFAPFPFPAPTEQQRARVRELGEALDAHRKRQQAQHAALTITDTYNVLEKLRRGEPLNERERATHEQGLVSVLRQIHEALDAAASDAYGWPATLPDEEVLERLVRLNAERGTEERAGLVRWLRPEFQKPAEGVAAAFGEEFAAAPAAPPTAGQEKQPWPKTIPEQARAVRLALASRRGVVTPQQLAKCFTRARAERIEELLQTLVSLGQAREVSEGRYAS